VPSFVRASHSETVTKRPSTARVGRLVSTFHRSRGRWLSVRFRSRVGLVRRPRQVARISSTPDADRSLKSWCTVRHERAGGPSTKSHISKVTSGRCGQMPRPPTRPLATRPWPRH